MIHFHKLILCYRYFSVKRRKIIRMICKNSYVRGSKVKKVIPCTFFIKRCYTFNMHVVKRLHYKVEEEHFEKRDGQLYDR